MPARPTLADRLDRLAAELDRVRIDLHVPGAAEHAFFIGSAIVEVGVTLAPDTFTVKPFTASGRGR
jgi:hypothetical protein